MSQKFKGAVLGYVAIAVGIVTTLVFTPVLIRELGTDNYGILSLAMAFVAYVSILDLGMNDSLLRFFVKQGTNTRRKSEFLGRMLTTYIFIGLIIISVVWLLAESFDLFFQPGLTPAQTISLEKMFKIVGVGAAIMIASNPLSSLIYAEERFVFLRLVEIATSTASIFIIWVLLILDFGLVEIAWSMCAFKIVTAFLRLTYVRFVLRCPVGLKRPEWIELRRILSYSAPIFAVAFAMQFFHRLDHLIIGAKLGAAAVSIFAIGVMFNKYFMSLGIVITRVFTPNIIRKIDSGMDGDKILDLLVYISRLQAPIIFLMVGGVVVFGKSFIFLWLGDEFSLSYCVLLLVLVPLALELIGNSRNIVLQVKEMYWLRLVVVAVMAITNASITLLLISDFGILAAGIGTCIATILGYVVLGFVLDKKVGVSFFSYFSRVYGRALPLNTLLMGVGFWLTEQIQFNWLFFISGVVIYSGLYSVLTYIFYLHKEERRFFTNRIWKVVRA